MKRASKKKPVSRFSRWKKKLTKAGGRRVTAHLNPDAAAVLGRLEQGTTVTAVMNRALIYLGGEQAASPAPACGCWP